MKRALAERAKQSGLPNGVSPSSSKPPLSIKTVNRSSEGQSSVSDRPESALSTTPSPRLDALKQSSRAVSSPKPNSASPRPKKRLRESIVKLEEEGEDDSNASSFYLRHQNRALASELRMLQYQLSRLEREREYRRSHCSKAVQILNSLQATWTQMESALQCGPQKADEDQNSMETDNDATPSTGSGQSVELIGSLLNSLAALGAPLSSKKGRIREDGEEEEHDVKPGDFMDEGGTRQLDDLLRITDNVSKRALILQKWIWAVLQQTSASSIDLNLDNPGASQDEKIASLIGKNKLLEAQLMEVSISRDEMSKSDKRVRRGLYRLAAGRVKLKEVLKDIVDTDNDKEAAAKYMEEAPIIPVVAPTATATAAELNNGGEGGTKATDSAAMASLSRKVDEVQEIANARDAEIKMLLKEKEEQIKKINALMLKTDDNNSTPLSDEQVKQSNLFVELTVKLLVSERKAQTSDEKLEKLRKEWSQALADTEEAQKAMEEMKSKHLKKWKDFSEDRNDGAEMSDENAIWKNNAEENIRLQHKLKQAIENVRQAETTRKSLEEAVSMNQTLQAKLEEVKAKYLALQASRSSSGNASNSQSSTSGSSSGASSTKQKHSSSFSSSNPSGEKNESSEKHEKDAKLHREFRKIRKELAAAIASKEAAKAKLSTSERERQSLSQANARLLKQAAERDDVNAKSLSTILHLKQLTDQMSKEKDNFENQIKSSQQISLAARLAVNARERVIEEFEKARKDLDLQVKDWEDKFSSVSKQKEMLEGKLTQQKAIMASALKDLEKSKKRCDELACDSTKLDDEKRLLKESLAVAKQQASKAASLSRTLVDKAGIANGVTSSGFTADQLSTQVSVLKNRLVCPVCNVRDKNCILLRCRHMFCKHCVEENIKNRSRKCPACGSRFDTKDVADVWL